MTDDRLPLAELLAKAGDSDFLRSVAEAVLQMLMEADVDGLIGAGRHERIGERLNSATAFATARSTRGSAQRWRGVGLGRLKLKLPRFRGRFGDSDQSSAVMFLDPNSLGARRSKVRGLRGSMATIDG